MGSSSLVMVRPDRREELLARTPAKVLCVRFHCPWLRSRGTNVTSTSPRSHPDYCRCELNDFSRSFRIRHEAFARKPLRRTAKAAIHLPFNGVGYPDRLG
jgi:hypothetical protein